MFIGKTNGSSYRKSQSRPLIQPHSSTKATPFANAMRKAKQVKKCNDDMPGTGFEPMSSLHKNDALTKLG